MSSKNRKKRNNSDILPNGKSVTWPVYSESGKLIKDGTIDGVKFKNIWMACKRETNRWIKTKEWFEELEAYSKKEQAEIDAYWKSLSKKQREKIEKTKGTYIS